MVDDSRTPPDSRWPNYRRVWWWFAGGSVGAFAALWICTQIAKDHRQDPNWYTGFGQWLGALAAVIASAVALAIATTDRHRAEALHRAELDERERDLHREAGLVLVELEAQLTPTPVVLRNFRATRIAAIQVFLNDSTEPAPIAQVITDGDPLAGKYLRYRALEPGRTFSIRTETPVDAAHDHVAVRYTDLSGRRWEVDDRQHVRKLDQQKPFW